MKEKLSNHKFDVIYDMNGREAEDSIPLIDMYKNSVDHFIYMSSAGVYKKSVVMPHIEVNHSLLKFYKKQSFNFIPISFLFIVS